MPLLQTLGLFILTAVAEIIGCWLVLMWRKPEGTVWLLAPAALSLAAFAWLLTLHPAASGRVYAAYGGVYVATALVWLWAVDGVRPGVFDLVGGGLILVGAVVIISGHWVSTAS